MRARQLLYTAFAATALCASSMSAQITIGEIGNGASGSTYPFGFSGGYLQFQQVYASSLFSGAQNIGGISFYSKAGTQILQQGTFNFYLNTTTTTPAAWNTNTPSANVNSATRQLFGTFDIGANVDAPDVLTFTGTNSFLYEPMDGNLVLEVDFVPIGNFVNSGRAAFDRYFSPQGDTLVSTASNRQALFGTSAGSRGTGLVTTFTPAVAVVPEPSTVMLMLAGLAGLAVVARRRGAGQRSA